MKSTIVVFNYAVNPVKNSAKKTIDIHIDGEIIDSTTKGWYEKYFGEDTSVSYKFFRDSVPSDVEVINLFVNSPGGHVGDAMAIHDYLIGLEESGVIVNREGRGIVASAATYLVMGKNSRMSENSIFMIHEVSSFAYGTLSEMQTQLNSVKVFNDLIINFYSKGTGQTKETIAQWMKEEKYMTADVAEDLGFVSGKSAAVDLENIKKFDPTNWNIGNPGAKNIYNSFFTTKNKKDEMDIKVITNAIRDGFKEMMQNLGISLKEGDQSQEKALNALTEKITSAFNSAGIPDEAAIKNLVDSAMNDIDKKEAFQTAITNAVKKASESFLTKEDLTNELKTLTDSITDLVGNNAIKKEEKEEKPNRTPKNRVSNWDSEDFI